MEEKLIYFFDDIDVPDQIKNLRTWRVAERIGHARCFYTGVECEFQISPEHRPWTASTEHLIVARGIRSHPDNIVLACSIANSAIGSAPLPVKMEAKEAFEKMKLDPLTKSTVKNLIMTIIGKYTVSRGDGRMTVPAWDRSIISRKQQAEADAILSVLREKEKQYTKILLPNAFTEEI